MPQVCIKKMILFNVHLIIYFLVLLFANTAHKVMCYYIQSILRRSSCILPSRVPKMIHGLESHLPSDVFVCILGSVWDSFPTDKEYWAAVIVRMCGGD